MKKPSSPSYFLYTHRIWTINQTHKQEHPSNLLLSVSPFPSGETAGRSRWSSPTIDAPPVNKRTATTTIWWRRQWYIKRVRSEKAAAVRWRKSQGNKTGSR
ncbi:hypothetical protein Hanom_Chr00s193992g01835791 [Helianthus anomalus]